MSFMLPEDGPARWGEVDDAPDPTSFVTYLDAVRLQPGIASGKAGAIEALHLRRGDRVVDVGCGTGEDLDLMARLVGPEGRALGLDSSRVMVGEAARRHAGAAGSRAWARSDILALPLADGSVDAVYVDRVLQHVPAPAEAVRELVRVLRPGGRASVTEPDHTFQALDLPDLTLRTRRLVERFAQRTADASVRHTTIGRQLYQLLRAAGLVDVAVAPCLTLLTGDAAMAWIRSTLSAAGPGGLDRALGPDGPALERSLAMAERDSTGTVLHVLFRATGRVPGP